MKITERIKFALNEAVRAAGNRNQLALKVGVVQNHIKRWLDGPAKSIDDDKYEKLLPFIRPYFKEFKGKLDLSEINESGLYDVDPKTLKAVKHEFKEDVAPYAKNSEVELIQHLDVKNKLFPVVSEAAAAECNPGFMPLLDCIEAYAEEDRVYFSKGKDGDFVIRVSGHSMMPWYPQGTLLLVRPYADLHNGKRVVAVLDDGEIIFKVFLKTKDKVALVSINEGEGKDYVFPVNGKGIRYICRVIQSQRDEDELDTAMEEAGIHHEWEEKLRKLEKK